jgi:DNA-directed RNA polymerases I and III subunit RPAC1
LVGIDASIANAFRRILLAEVPTIAIEDVFVYNNTSIIHDEVLAQRLGLIPLTGNPEGFKKMNWYIKSEENPSDVTWNANDYNTIVANLKIKCTMNPNAAKDEPDPQKRYKNAHVYARDIEFVRNGAQEEWFSEENGPVRASNPDILIAKLRPDQELDIEVYCRKGVGGDHAKFQPVATASYRLLPCIQILKPIIGVDAKKFARCFPKGVIGLTPVTEDDVKKKKDYEGHVGEQKAVVQNTFKDTVSRECLRHEEFQGKVKLGRVRDHFIFSVESTGQYESDDLFLESLKVFKAKIWALKNDLETITR